MEWQVSFVAGEAPRPTATLQLCAPNRPACTEASTAISGQGEGKQSSSPCPHSSSSSLASVWGTAFVFHLSAMRRHPSTGRGVRPKPPSPTSSTRDAGTKDEDIASTETIIITDKTNNIGGDEAKAGHNRHHNLPAGAYLPESLVRVLSDPGILLAGVGVGGDVNRLEKEYEQLRASGVGGVVDLSEVAKRKVVPDRRRRGMWSLADLCDELLQLELRKPSSLRTGSWEKQPLSVDQLFYAAADAYAGLRLWQVMRGMPDLVLQRAGANAPRRDTTAVVEVVPPSSDTTSTGDAGGSGGKGKVEARIEKKGCQQPALGGEATSSANANDTNKGPATSRVRPRLPQSKLETHRLWHEDGLSVDTVAEVRCNKASTVRGYLSDCIEAGLPYDWSRLGIDPTKEETIVGAILAVTGNDPRAAVGRDPTTASAACVENKDKEPDASSGDSGSDGKNPAAPNACGAKPRTVPLAASGSRAGDLEANVVPPPNLAATENPSSCGSTSVAPAAAAATAAVGAADGRHWEERGGNGPRTANVATAVRVVNMGSEGVCCISERGTGGDSSDGGSGGGGSSNEASAARVAPRAGAEGGAEGAKERDEMGRWDSVRLKEVKELAPTAEYWEIRMVLARLKAGWCGYSS
eukprot:g12442.t2